MDSRVSSHGAQSRLINIQNQQVILGKQQAKLRFELVHLKIKVYL
jgi:hypothetical protein